LPGGGRAGRGHRLGQGAATERGGGPVRGEAQGQVAGVGPGDGERAGRHGPVFELLEPGPEGVAGLPHGRTHGRFAGRTAPPRPAPPRGESPGLPGESESTAANRHGFSAISPLIAGVGELTRGRRPGVGGFRPGRKTGRGSARAKTAVTVSTPLAAPGPTAPAAGTRAAGGPGRGRDPCPPGPARTRSSAPPTGAGTPPADPRGGPSRSARRCTRPGTGWAP